MVGGGGGSLLYPWATVVRIETTPPPTSPTHTHTFYFLSESLPGALGWSSYLPPRLTFLKYIICLPNIATQRPEYLYGVYPQGQDVFFPTFPPSAFFLWRLQISSNDFSTLYFPRVNTIEDLHSINPHFISTYS